ncbi:transcription factor MYB3R-5-like [Vigna unguiculata]|uniref:transcription factor MYB3R-5-like n=1 Tax=Vigna unguiculata TaxID=3917 RepID=UPI0010161D57|nr:transcription factor MYB3R-5-like [Vigna unguiculata]XP_027904434.1 transcription factor MYB3R-5-like [Vigna unguiculata]
MYGREQLLVAFKSQSQVPWLVEKYMKKVVCCVSAMRRFSTTNQGCVAEARMMTPEFFPDKSEVQCLHRWKKVLNPELVKGHWTKEEDDKIIELVSIHGSTKWSLISQSLPGRIGKQCREQWCNHLSPDIKKDP